MKFPRWLVVTLLSASLIALLGTAAWWWVTLPQRIMNEFAQAEIAGSRQRELLHSDLVVFFDGDGLRKWAYWVRPWNVNVMPRSRRLKDILAGHQEFEETK